MASNCVRQREVFTELSELENASSRRHVANDVSLAFVLARTDDNSGITVGDVNGNGRLHIANGLKLGVLVRQADDLVANREFAFYFMLIPFVEPSEDLLSVWVEPLLHDVVDSLSAQVSGCVARAKHLDLLKGVPLGHELLDERLDRNQCPLRRAFNVNEVLFWNRFQIELL